MLAEDFVPCSKLQLTSADAFLQKAPISFDASVQVIHALCLHLDEPFHTPGSLSPFCEAQPFPPCSAHNINLALEACTGRTGAVQRVCMRRARGAGSPRHGKGHTSAGAPHGAAGRHQHVLRAFPAGSPSHGGALPCCFQDSFKPNLQSVLWAYCAMNVLTLRDPHGSLICDERSSAVQGAFVLSVTDPACRSQSWRAAHP